VTPAAIRAAFEKCGTPEPTTDGPHLFYEPAYTATLRLSIVEVSWQGDTLRTVCGGAPPPDGLYLPIARLLAAVEVAEAAAIDHAADLLTEHGASVRVGDALTAYRSTRSTT
jgi:hypothetical protein